jgi:hypothetical protein
MGVRATQSFPPFLPPSLPPSLSLYLLQVAFRSNVGATKRTLSSRPLHRFCFVRQPQGFLPAVFAEAVEALSKGLKEGGREGGRVRMERLSLVIAAWRFTHTKC